MHKSILIVLFVSFDTFTSTWGSGRLVHKDDRKKPTTRRPHKPEFAWESDGEDPEHFFTTPKPGSSLKTTPKPGDKRPKKPEFAFEEDGEDPENFFGSTTPVPELGKIPDKHLEQEPTECEKHRDSNPTDLDVKCNKDGHYKHLQCKKGSKECACFNRTLGAITKYSKQIKVCKCYMARYYAKQRAQGCQLPAKGLCPASKQCDLPICHPSGHFRPRICCTRVSCPAQTNLVSGPCKLTATMECACQDLLSGERKKHGKHSISCTRYLYGYTGNKTSRETRSKPRRRG